MGLFGGEEDAGDAMEKLIKRGFSVLDKDMTRDANKKAVETIQVRSTYLKV